MTYQDYPTQWRLKQDFLEIEDVRDWNERIKSYDYKTKQLYDLAFKKHKEFVDLAYTPAGTNSWKTTTKKPDLTVEEKISERGLPTIRVTVEYDYDILTVIRCMSHAPTRVACDMLI